jgi:hypothetical protein
MLVDVQKTYNKLLENDPCIIDPFDTIYHLIYLITMRSFGCNEVADDPVMLKKLLKYNTYIEQSATPTLILFPWFPGPALLKKLYAYLMIYLTFNNIIKNRKKTGRKENDAMQFMMDQGDKAFHIIAVSYGLNATSLHFNRSRSPKVLYLQDSSTLA